MTSSLTIDRVGREANEIFVNLFELYMHDMAEWFQFDVRDNGRYGYDMSPHWKNQDPVYLARVNGALAGFALLGTAERWINRSDVHDVRDFFVVRRHRRSGIGQAMARRIWDEHPGEWLVRVLEANTPAVPFWRKVIAEYTGGHYSEERVVPDGRGRIFFSFHA